MENNPQPQLLGFNLLTLKIFLIWPDEDQKNTFLTALKSNAFYFAPIYIGGVTTFSGILRQLLFGFDDFGAVIECTIGLVDSLGGFYMRYCFLENVSKIKVIINSINEFKKFCPEKEIVATEVRVRLFTKVMLLYCILGNITNSLIPLTDIENCKSQRKSQLLIERDPCGATSRAFYPFNASEYPLVLFIYFLQFYSAVIISMCILIITMLLVGIIMHICNQLRYCRKLMRELCESEDNEVIAKKLKVVVMYHIQIIEFFKNTNEAFRKMNLLYLSLTSLIISVLGFEILMINSFVDSMRYSLQLFGWMVLLLLVCYYGEQLINESGGLVEDTYSISWYTTSIGIQKDLGMVIMRSQRPLKLSAASMGVMSFPTFLRVMKSAYSYFTLLLNLKT